MGKKNLMKCKNNTTEVNENYVSIYSPFSKNIEVARKKSLLSDSQDLIENDDVNNNKDEILNCEINENKQISISIHSDSDDNRSIKNDNPENIKSYFNENYDSIFTEIKLDLDENYNKIATMYKKLGDTESFNKVSSYISNCNIFTNDSNYMKVLEALNSYDFDTINSFKNKISDSKKENVISGIYFIEGDLMKCYNTLKKIIRKRELDSVGGYFAGRFYESIYDIETALKFYNFSNLNMKTSFKKEEIMFRIAHIFKRKRLYKKAKEVFDLFNCKDFSDLFRYNSLIQIAHINCLEDKWWIAEINISIIPDAYKNKMYRNIIAYLMYKNKKFNSLKRLCVNKDEYNEFLIYLTARVDIEEYNYEIAIKKLNHLVTNFRNSFIYWNTLGIAYYNINSENSIYCFNKALEVNQNFYEAKYNLNISKSAKFIDIDPNILIDISYCVNNIINENIKLYGYNKVRNLVNLWKYGKYNESSDEKYII